MFLFFLSFTSFYFTTKYWIGAALIAKIGFKIRQSEVFLSFDERSRNVGRSLFLDGSRFNDNLSYVIKGCASAKARINMCHVFED